MDSTAHEDERREVVRLAAIDIGTVTTRLLVADVDEFGICEVERSTQITHLGEGLSASGELAPEAMRRVADVIGGYALRMGALGVESYSAIATSASRDAGNATEFAEMLSAHGVVVEVISGSREAELSFLGATYEHSGERLLVVDCGGGSTELILGDAAKVSSGGPAAGPEDADTANTIHAARSIDVGSKRMTERYLLSDPPRRDEIDSARAWATGEFRYYFDRLDEPPSEMLALAGTATTIAAIKLGLAEYDPALVHGLAVAGSEVSEILEMLAALPFEERLGVTGLHPGRAGVIVAGALILETVLALAGLDQMIVSEHDILYGILLDALRKRRGA